MTLRPAVIAIVVGLAVIGGSTLAMFIILAAARCGARSDQNGDQQ